MSAKLEATVHGSRVEDHLRRIAPFGEDEALLMEAVNTILRLREQVAGAGANALLSAAKEAKIRGDIGKPGCVEVWDWLEYRAKQVPDV
jgi:hypothetical protein